MLKRLLLLLVLVALAAFVWPTLYRFDHITIDGDSYLVRIHRFGGHADILVPEEGWIPADQPWDSDVPLPDGGRS